MAESSPYKYIEVASLIVPEVHNKVTFNVTPVKTITIKSSKQPSSLQNRQSIRSSPAA